MKNIRNSIQLFSDNILPLMNDGQWYSANQLKGKYPKGVNPFHISAILAYVLHNTGLLERTAWRLIYFGVDSKPGAYCHYVYRSVEGYAKYFQKKKEMESYQPTKTRVVQLELPLNMNVSIHDIT